MSTMRFLLAAGCLMIACGWLPAGMAGEAAPEKSGETAQVLPYIPKADNQLMTLGKPDKPRFPVQDITWPEKPGEAEICLWKDDRYAAVSITIDDNCAPDHQWWLEQCQKYGFHVTWFLITGRVNDKSGFNGTWEGYRKIVEAGHAVESHTIRHKAFSAKDPEDEVRKEYAGSRQMIETNIGIPGYRCLTMAYPRGSGVESIAMQYFIAVRGVYGTPNPANAINYANTNKGGLEPDQIHTVLGEPIEDPKLKWLNRPEYRRGWLSPLFHLVYHGTTTEEREAGRRNAAATLENLARYKDRLWIDTFVNVVEYGQERDSATLHTTASSGDRITLTLSDRMRDDIFQYPLTLKVRLPDSWTTVKATQDGKPVDAVLVTHAGKPYALVQAVPDQGEITLSR